MTPDANYGATLAAIEQVADGTPGIQGTVSTYESDAMGGVLTAGSYPAAVVIARRIGLVNTMVFSHLPANLCMMALPFAPNLASAVALILGWKVAGYIGADYVLLRWIGTPWRGKVADTQSAAARPEPVLTH